MKTSFSILFATSVVFAMGGLFSGFSGCDDDKSPSLDIAVDIAGITTAERQLIDRVEIEIVGTDVPEISEPVSAFKNNLFETTAKNLNIKKPLTALVRASVFAGDFEVAGETQNVDLKSDSGAIALTFNLASPLANMNRCSFAQIPSKVLPDTVDVHTFDVTPDSNGFMLVYSDYKLKDGNIHTVKLDAQGKTTAQPVRIINAYQKSEHPSIVKTASGFTVAWQNPISINDTESAGLQVTAVDANGAIVEGSLLLGSSQRETFASVASPSSGKTAVAWLESSPATFTPRVVTALLSQKIDGAPYGFASPRILGGGGVGAMASYAKNIALLGSSSGYATVWSEKSPGNQNYNLKYARLDDNLGIVHQINVRNNVGDATHAVLTQSSSGFMIAWEDTRNGESSIFTSVVSPNGIQFGEEHATGNSSSRTYSPSLSWNGSNAGLAYLQPAGPNLAQQVFLSRLNATGARLGLDNNDMQLSRTSAFNVTSTRVMPLPNGFLVFWNQEKTGDPGELFVARVSCQ